jgi:hypothetical protein
MLSLKFKIQFKIIYKRLQAQQFIIHGIQNNFEVSYISLEVRINGVESLVHFPEPHLTRG